MHRHSKSLCWRLGLLQSLRWTWHRHRKASRGELLPGLGTWIWWQSHWPRPFRPRWAFVCGWCGRKPWSFVGWHRLNCRSLGQLSFQPPGMMPTLQCNHIPEGSLAEACWIKPASCMELFPRSHRSHRSHCIIVTTWAETAFVYLLWLWKTDHHGSPFGPLVTFTNLPLPTVPLHQASKETRGPIPQCGHPKLLARTSTRTCRGWRRRDTPVQSWWSECQEFQPWQQRVEQWRVTIQTNKCHTTYFLAPLMGARWACKTEVANPKQECT